MSTTLRDVPSMDAPAASFTEHHALTACPRCAASTRGADQCPACALVLDDATLETYRGERRRARHWQSLALGGLLLGLFTGSVGAAAGYQLGQRAALVSARASTTASSEATTNVFRALPRQTRFQLHATQLQFLYAPGLLAPYAIRFAPVAVPQQTKAPGTDDVTYVARTDSAWRQLSSDERQVIVAALAQKHAAFLGLSGASDTAGFAAVLAAHQADGTERILAVRDRRGQLFIQP